MVKQIKIAISGKASAGKNTIANLLVEHFGFSEDRCKIVALADPMKNIIKIMFPAAEDKCLFGASEFRSQIISPDYLDQDKNALTYRRALVDLGKFGRQYNTNIWLKCLTENAKNCTDKLLYIAADCRFINEYQHLKEAGFYMIRVKRDNCSQIDDVSETEQDQMPDSNFHYIIDNNGTIEELSQQVIKIVNNIKNDNSYVSLEL